jgi:ABC-type phosphate transport system substrate-binding protein
MPRHQRVGPRTTLGVLVVAMLSLLAWSTGASATPGVGGTSGTQSQSSSSGLSGSAIDASGVSLDGTGSSFAAPALLTWVNDVGNAPYSLQMVYTSSSSGQGRYEFTNQTTDFAVSDIGYVGNTDTTPPSFPFNFIPITAGGIAFMYNVPGVTKTLQLTSYTACALLTGGIKNWDDPALATANPGVSLPNLAVVPVTESDSAGTNFVLEEWCIDEQPGLWTAFVNQQDSQSGGPSDGVTLSTTNPESNWPGIQGGLDDQSTTAVAGDVATNAGAIGAVQVSYATGEPGFSGSDPSKSVALVQNASGDYTGPTPVDVASALAYATQLPDGTHKLDFNGLGPHTDHRVVGRQGRGHERIRQLCTDPGPAEGAVNRLCQPWSLAGAVRDQRRDDKRAGIGGPDRGREGGLRVRRPHAARGAGGPEHPHVRRRQPDRRPASPERRHGERYRIDRGFDRRRGRQVDRQRVDGHRHVE